ncbi:hypothetical protein EW026_g2607 [Hermanssonia centrifuga]|uniref:Peptidase A1 domain-containing protein n=1 Tax=Hermanssonia centrifuga TaxID=98765 RepID=A0A4S4KPM8_9APHY|nr:hypothetical protein EW026_g2607 [Hermanssonia centrifuga]
MKATGQALKHYSWNAGASSSSSGSAASVDDFQDLLYKLDIVLGGQPFTVQMDTGSADLWVKADSTPIKLTNTTNINVTEAYGAGVASGLIQFAQLELDGFIIPSQAFINADSAEDFGFFDEGAVGIMGLAFNDAGLSPINDGIRAAFGQDNTLGQAAISNIIAQNPSISNSFDILLDRTSDLDDDSTGIFIIGSHLQGFEDITSQPKLFRQTTGRWSVPCDGMTVNGGLFEFNQSSVAGVDSGRIATLLDSGFSLPPLPPPAVDFLYGSIPGAVFAQTSYPQWIVPCTGATNLTFTFGGKDFPVHPLDLTIVDTTTITVNGTSQNVTICYNAYQYLDLDPNSFNGFDAILGDSFLRNVYASFDYGDTDSTGVNSFVQLISTTNQGEALTDFAATRAQVLKSLPPTIDPATFLDIYTGGDGSPAVGDVASGALDASDSTPSAVPAGSDSSSDRLNSLVEKYGPIIIGLLAGNALIGVLLCIIALTVCLRGVVKSGARSRNINPTYAPVRFKEAEAAEDRMAYHD